MTNFVINIECKMNTAEINTNLIESYYSLLKNLSPNNKLELISKLVKSMKSELEISDNSWKSLFGSIELDETAKEFVDGLKKDRKFVEKNFEF